MTGPELRRRDRQHSRVTRPNIEHTDSHTDLTRLTDSCPLSLSLSLSLSQHPQNLTAPSLKNVVVKWSVLWEQCSLSNCLDIVCVLLGCGQLWDEILILLTVIFDARRNVTSFKTSNFLEIKFLFLFSHFLILIIQNISYKRLNKNLANYFYIFSFSFRQTFTKDIIRELQKSQQFTDVNLAWAENQKCVWQTLNDRAMTSQSGSLRYSVNELNLYLLCLVSSDNDRRRPRALLLYSSSSHLHTIRLSLSTW